MRILFRNREILYKMEPEKTYYFRVDTQSRNEFQALCLSALQRIIVTVSEEHLENLGMDVSTLIENYGVSWILLSMSAEIKNPIRSGERLEIRTWHTNKKGIYFRRDIEIRHEDGSLAAVAATFSSIFDMEKRRICGSEAVNAMVEELGEGKELLSAESRIRIKPEELPVILEEKIMPSWIDSLGHVNNLRYADFITDALPEEKRKMLGKLRRYELGFTGELRFGESVEIRLDEKENGEILAAGVRSLDGKPSFLARLVFEE